MRISRRWRSIPARLEAERGRVKRCTGLPTELDRSDLGAFASINRGNGHYQSAPSHRPQGRHQSLQVKNSRNAVSPPMRARAAASGTQVRRSATVSA